MIQEEATVELLKTHCFAREYDPGRCAQEARPRSAARFRQGQFEVPVGTLSHQRRNGWMIQEEATVELLKTHCFEQRRRAGVVVSAPGSHASMIQVDAHKKLVLVQLLAFGKVSSR
jgi:hypothetical protein